MSEGGAIELGPGVWAAEGSVRLGYARSSGPGGQNVNKLNTKAELWVSLAAISGLPEPARQRLAALAGRRLTAGGEIHLSAQTSRSQEGNREAVLERLRELIVQALHQPKRRRRTQPTKASRQRRLEAKRRRGEAKQNRRGGAGGE